MAKPLELETLVGAWEGTNRLWMDPRGSGEPSAATAAVAAVARGGFASIANTWTYEGGAQDGLLLVRRGARPGPLDAVWVDSFHTNGAIQTFVGEVDPSGRRSFHGTYPVQDGPAWGWRMAIEQEGEATFVLAMWNVPPGETEERAVEARFRRVGSG